jgi:RNA polymerase sigma-B factor
VTSPRARDELIERHLPLARWLARRYSRNAEQAEDIGQVAALGLVKAADRFDPGRGVAFTAFAVPTITGEIKRYFRDTSWAVHVPRSLQDRSLRVEATIERLAGELGRSPSPGEVAQSLGLPVEDVLEARHAYAAFEAVSLDGPSGDEESVEAPGDWHAAIDPGYAQVEDRVALEPALAKLSRRERLALRLRFEGDMHQREIGECMGVSQMHVSRILRRSIDTLQAATEF